MVVEAQAMSVFVAALTGLGLSVGLEQMMKPCPLILRSHSAWALHGGLYLLGYGLFTLVLGRPWFATGIVLAVLLMLVLVSNTKVKALREPFVFHDYTYFTAMLKHPRLYLPFLGMGKFLVVTLGFVLAMVIGLYAESSPDQRFTVFGQFGAVAGVLLLSIFLLLAGNRKLAPVTFTPASDLHANGMLANLWSYGKEQRHLPVVVSPFKDLKAARIHDDLPHLIAVQSESFFDPRSLFSGINTTVLSELDHIKISAIAHGKLRTPSWGANTVRTEFEFLSGIDNEKLGVHRFNPYGSIVAGFDVSSLPSYLKSLGYRTICVHPYSANFYQRDRVFPRLGFDEFLDIESFNAPYYVGPYISDLSVAEKIKTILDEATCPVFIFAITMENHGPLHLEDVEASDRDTLYSTPLPPGCEDLTIYLRHLRNADQMIASLRSTLNQCKQPSSLCWYGDHVPVMPTVYSTLGDPNGDVEYFVWNSKNMNSPKVCDVSAHNLSLAWLRYNGIIQS